MIKIALLSTLTVSSVATKITNWTKLGDGPYSKREGLMGVSYKDNIYLSGGRETYGVGFSNEVWRSSDGKTWELAAKGAFDGRAYHIMLVKDDCMWITGGQTFTTFYNDVWKSCDGLGASWEKVTSHAPFPARAGLGGTVTSTGELVIAGGCYNKAAVIRSFWGDVWASSDGITWEERTSNAEWRARSGTRLIEDKNGHLLVIAGEVGFTPSTQLVDTWSSSDGGRTWSLLAANPGFSNRSGHGVVVTPQKKDILVIAGWPHLHDAYVSKDNAQTFVQISNQTWNCNSDDCGKFDFWPLIHEGRLYTLGGSGAYSTFGTLFQDTWVADIIEDDEEEGASSRLRGSAVYAASS